MTFFCNRNCIFVEVKKLHNLDLIKMIQMGENAHQDFKFAITDSRKIARSLSAFANTKGGRLLIGVKDNGKIAGVRSDEEYYMVEAAAHLYSKPEIKITPKILRHEGKTVLEISVPESKGKPHYVDEGEGSKIAYVRVADQNIKANEVIRKVWELNKQKRDRLVRYTEAEETLFKLLQEHEPISLTLFKKKARISKEVAVKTLANMVVFNLIYMEISEHQTNYFLNIDKSIDR